MLFVSRLPTPAFLAAFAASVLAVLQPTTASADATLLIEADSGRVLHTDKATLPWYPASVTKLMTLYVTLQAVKSRRLTLDTLLTVSARAAAQQPSKMGFRPGLTVTIDAAIKMLMVKSANDIAVVLAEGVGGSVEKFADEMNAASHRLGMTQSSWVNPNGLPAENQISSARDLGLLAMALWNEFPEYDFYWSIPAIQVGKKVMRNTNSLVGRYNGLDGMKTGFICASGFNVVASATRNGKRLIVVVLGSPSSAARAVKAASLLERGFAGSNLSWLAGARSRVSDLPPTEAAPVDLRDEMCGSHRKRPAAEDSDEDPVAGIDPTSPQSFLLSSLAPAAKGALLNGPAVFRPIVVHTGPARVPAETQFAAARARLGISEPTAAVASVPVGKNAKRKGVTPPAPGTQVATAGTPPPIPAQPSGFTPSTQVVGPPPSQFTPQPGQTTANATDRPSWLSFTTPASADDAAPLTSAPQAVPMPRPRPKTAARKP